MNSRFFASRIFTTIIVLLVISGCFMTPLASISFVHALEIPGTSGGAAGATAGVQASQGTTQPKTSCAPWWNWFINFTTCGGRSLAVWIGTGLIYITSWFLGVAGVLFNWVIDFTISPQMYSSIQGGVNGVWTAFRDVSNIIIIGMFTFIAISMILGVESFGSRKMVARVLIIAVLINFSLLFTRIIIESSNFVARQFYKAVQLQTGVPVSPDVAGANASSDAQFIAGISGRFAQLMGVAGIWDTREALMKTAENQDNGWIALLQGLLTAMVFLAAAGTFLYAAFLLIARALLFIFLLITSAPAFAAYLVPKMGDQYWSMWWGSLLRNGIFAPLLMLLLWATVTVGEGLVAATGSTGSLGSLLAEPANGGNVNALFNYLIILGMLFISIKFASSFSTKIAGYDFTSGALRGLGGLGFTVGARGIGFAGRELGGRAAARLLATDTVAKASGMGGRTLRGALAGAATGSWDGRSIPGIAQAGKQLGIALGKAAGKGGFIQSEKDKDKKLKEKETAMAALVGRETSGERTARQQHEERGSQSEGRAKEAASTLTGAKQQATEAQKMALSTAEKELRKAEEDLKNVPFMEKNTKKAQDIQSNIKAQTDKIEKIRDDFDKNVNTILAGKGYAGGADAVEQAIAEDQKMAKESKETIGKIKEQAAQRKEGFVETIGETRYLAYYGSRSRAKELQSKVKKEVAKSDEEKENEKLRKLLAKVAKDEHKEGSGEEKKEEGKDH